MEEIRMMDLKLNALIIEKGNSLAEPLAVSLEPDISFEEELSVGSMHHALQAQMEGGFNICFIAEGYATGEVEGFANDIRKLKRPYPCVLIQVRDKVDLDFDRSSLEKFGISTVVSLVGDHRDKTAIWGAVKPLIERKEREDLFSDVGRAIELLASDIDRAARDRRRGAKGRLSKIFSQFIHKEASADEELLASYLDTLCKLTESAEPTKKKALSVPKEVLQKNLPFLTETGYGGQSSRVWEKLIKLHGEAKEKDSAEPTPPELPKDKSKN